MPLYTVVTGAAGFIGSNLVRALNDRGNTDIIAVDNLARADKFRNLVDCEIADYLDKDEFLARLEGGDFDDDLDAILHQGACSDTMEADGRYMMQNNYRYSVELLTWCQAQDVALLYASSAAVYGGGRVFREERAAESPLNVYGYSKFLFDQYVRRMLDERTAQVAGFRYFNVYGPRESHKGRMASVSFHFFDDYRKSRRVRLFEGSGGFADGEQRRDFVHVDDVVDVNLHFLDHRDLCGIFNVGTGRAQSFNDVAVATVNACREIEGLPPLALAQMVDEKLIEYIPMPVALRDKYQSYTEADIGRLREAGYARPMRGVEDGVARYVAWLHGNAVNAAAA